MRRVILRAVVIYVTTSLSMNVVTSATQRGRWRDAARDDEIIIRSDIARGGVTP